MKYSTYNVEILTKIPPVKSLESLSMDAKTPSPSNVEQVIVNLCVMNLSTSDHNWDHTGIKN